MDEQIDTVFLRGIEQIYQSEDPSSLLDYLIDGFEILFKLNKTVSYIYCEKVIDELQTKEGGFGFQVIPKYIERICEYTRQVKQPAQILDYAIPHSRPSPLEIQKLDLELEYFRHISSFQKAALTYVNQILHQRLEIYNRLRNKQQEGIYRMLKINRKLHDKFQENFEASSAYISLYANSQEISLKEARANYNDSNILLIESQRLNEKIINLNEEIINRMEKYLFRQRNLPLDFGKLLQKRETEIRAKSIQLTSDHKELDNEITEFFNDYKTLSIENKRNKISYSKRDLFTYACLYLLVGIAIGFALKEFQIQAIVPKKYT